MRLQHFTRAAIFMLAMVGVAGAAPIAYQQLVGVKSCPALGLLPACYVVLVGYGLIALSPALSERRRPWVFLCGWAPLFLLALMGSTLELLVQPTCPRSSVGVPACFLSMFLIGLIAVLYAVERVSAKKSRN